MTGCYGGSCARSVISNILYKMRKADAKFPLLLQGVGRRIHRRLLFLYGGLCASLFLFLSACSSDSYDSGDGKYSYLTIDLVDAHSTDAPTIDYALTDQGDTLFFSSPIGATWATRPDSIYRALLYYYNNVSQEPVEAIAVSQVPVLRPQVGADSIGVDPLGYESGWVSSTGKWLNLRLTLKTGQEEGVDERQVLGLTCDSVKQFFSGSTTYYLTLRHNQNGVPEYYSTSVYVSIPVADVLSITETESGTNSPDSAHVVLDIPTDNGLRRIKFPL
jgi:hypothetical protein